MSIPLVTDIISLWNDLKDNNKHDTTNDINECNATYTNVMFSKCRLWDKGNVI